MSTVNRMKLAISTLVCPQWTLRQIVEAACSNGIGGIDFRGLGSEIDVTRLPDFNEGLIETLSMLKMRQLQMPCLNTSVTLLTPASARWEMMLEEALRTARLAEKTQTPFMRIFGGAVPKDMTRGQALNLAQRHLRQLLKICSGFGCMPLLETHDDWATSSEVLEMIHEFDPAQVGVLWDVEHSWRGGEQPSETFAGIRRYLRHVHFKDSVRIAGRNSPRLLGEGELPLRQCYAVLRDGGYDGWICLETEKRWHEEAPDPSVSIPQFAAFMRSLAAEAHPCAQ